MVDIISKNIIIIFLIIIAFVILFSFLTFLMSIKPGKWPIEFTPESFKLKYESVSFESSDGLKLKGWFLPSDKSNNTIIVMHGYPTNKANVLPFSMFLLKKFNVFLFDFRSFGESQGSYTTAGYKEVNDLDAAVKYLESRKDVKNIGALGFSLGGSVAIMNKNNNIKAVVADSAYSNLNNMIKVMYKLSNKGIAFNVMSKQVDWEKEGSFHLSFDVLAEFLAQQISRKFTFCHNYGLYEYTTYVYKN